MNAQQVQIRLRLGWERIEATVGSTHCVAHYVLRTMNGEPFRGFGFTITESRPFADGKAFLYRAANGGNYWAKSFAVAEAGVRRAIRTIMAREARMAT